MAEGRPTIRPEKRYKVKNKLSSAHDLAFVDETGRIAVADEINGVVRVFDGAGKLDHTVVNHVHPRGLAVNRAGHVAFTDCKGKRKRVTVCALSGDVIAQWGGDMIWKPKGVAFSNRGQLVISDVHEHKHSVGVYTLDGKALTRFGNKGTGRADFMNPWHVGIDIHDRILVSDRDNHTVKIFDPDGDYLGHFGGRGKNSGQLDRPRGVCSDGQGNILVSDTGNKRVCVFSPAGQFIDHVLTAGEHLACPLGLDFTSPGLLAVAQHNSNGNFRKVSVYQFEQEQQPESSQATGNLNSRL